MHKCGARCGARCDFFDVVLMWCMMLHDHVIGGSEGRYCVEHNMMMVVIVLTDVPRLKWI
jgi:hypothetical protein